MRGHAGNCSVGHVACKGGELSQVGNVSNGLPLYYECDVCGVQGVDACDADCISHNGEMCVDQLPTLDWHAM